MNLRSFLHEVDGLLRDMPKPELEAFIHETGRILPEKDRKNFLDLLRKFSAGETADMECGKQGKKYLGKAALEQEYEKIREQIVDIAEGEIWISGEPNYEYDDWYNSEEDEFIYHDPDGIADKLRKACQCVHQCVELEQYQMGYELAEALLLLEIDVEIDEYGESDLCKIHDLETYHLGKIDYAQLVTEGLYCAYCASDMDSRAEVLYEMIRAAKLPAVTLETVMQAGDELTDMDEFLTKWIAYLGTQTGGDAQRLLKEALEMSGDTKKLLECARSYCSGHPELYEQYLDKKICEWKEKGEDYGEILAVGDEALGKIETGYLLRSRIAKKLSVLTLENGLVEKTENYWLEAFRSDTNITNFMRLLLESRDGGIYMDEVKDIYHGMAAKTMRTGSFYGRRGGKVENEPDMETVYMLMFFGGEFAYVKEHAMNKTAALGWSETFMKCGLSAFLLFFYEGKELQTGGKEMCRRVTEAVSFDKEDYGKYAGKQLKMDSAGWFWQCFRMWKDQNGMETEEQQKYIRWLAKLIQKRVKGIMEANRRNYYGECAAYIAAFGEMLESRGETGAKQRVLMEYKKLYSRRSAFHQELRRYGLAEKKK